MFPQSHKTLSRGRQRRGRSRFLLLRHQPKPEHAEEATCACQWQSVSSRSLNRNYRKGEFWGGQNTNVQFGIGRSSYHFRAIDRVITPRLTPEISTSLPVRQPPKSACYFRYWPSSCCTGYRWCLRHSTQSTGSPSWQAASTGGLSYWSWPEKSIR